MPVSAPTVWEIRTTGNSQNGGGFDAAFGGTDYSQQAAPQLSLTDCTMSNVSTTLTSVIGGFTPAMVGNVVWLGAVAQSDGYRQITAYVSATQVTLNVNAPATHGGDGFCKVGGAQTLNQTGFSFLSEIAPGNKIWIGGGTYSIFVNGLTTNGIAGADAQPITVEGYLTTRGDGGRATIQYATSTIHLLAVITDYWIFKNLKLDNATNTLHCLLVNGGNKCHFENCLFIAGTGGGLALNLSGTGNTFRRNWFQGGTFASVNCAQITGAGHVFENNRFSGSGASASNGIAVNGGPFVMFGNIIHGHSQDGVYFSNGDLYGCYLRNNVIWNNGRDGIRNDTIGAGLAVHDIIANIIGKNAGYDFNYMRADATAQTGPPQWSAVAMRCNCFYTTGAGRVRQVPNEADFTALTVNPFLNDAGFDFHLNGLTGGGAAVVAAQCPQTFADGINVSYSIAGFGGVPQTPADAASLRSLWRELTNERDTAVVPDATVDIYLNRGLEALNRLIRYHWTTAATSIVFVASTQEYSIPADCIDVEWIEWGGKELDKESMDLWRRGTDPWRTEQTGAPRAWALYGQKLIFRPAPDGAAVAKQASPIIRYVSKPDDFATFGAAQLNTQDWPVIVYYGAALWSVCHPESALSASRAKDLMDLFNTEAERIHGDYGQREVKG